MRVFLCLLFLTVSAWAQPDWKVSQDGQHQGQLETCLLESPEWGQTQVRVFLPSAYEKDPSLKLPVLYVLDGQNVFQHPAQHPERDWLFDETVERQIASGRLPPLLVVSIDHPVARTEAYTSRRIWRPSQQEEGGQAEAYLKFFCRVQQLIQQRYRTNGDNGLVGASLGGIFALHAAFAPQAKLSRVAAVSPSLWWYGRPGVGELFAVRPTSGPMRLWLDMGEVEEEAPYGAQNVELAKSTAEWLAHCLGEGSVVEFKSYPEATHDEASWSRRLPDILEALYH